MFLDEIPPPLPPEERERLTGEHLRFQKSKAWMLLKHNEEGNIKLFDDEDYKRLKEKLRKQK